MAWKWDLQSWREWVHLEFLFLSDTFCPWFQVKKRNDPPPSLHGQLLWREFFYTAAYNNPDFDRMMNNPICVQIPWDTNPESLAKWAEVSTHQVSGIWCLVEAESADAPPNTCSHRQVAKETKQQVVVCGCVTFLSLGFQGKTGFPWIDAIMTQLRQEGWIHHLARHAVACFLTRGDLWISWEEGMKVCARNKTRQHDFLKFPETEWIQFPVLFEKLRQKVREETGGGLPSRGPNLRFVCCDISKWLWPNPHSWLWRTNKKKNKTNFWASDHWNV